MKSSSRSTSLRLTTMWQGLGGLATMVKRSLPGSLRSTLSSRPITASSRPTMIWVTKWVCSSCFARSDTAASDKRPRHLIGRLVDLDRILPPILRVLYVFVLHDVFTPSWACTTKSVALRPCKTANSSGIPKFFSFLKEQDGIFHGRNRITSSTTH